MSARIVNFPGDAGRPSSRERAVNSARTACRVVRLDFVGANLALPGVKGVE